MPSAALAITKPAPAGITTLYEMEESLLALADTEELVPAELEQQFLIEFQAMLNTTVEKRDRVGQFMNHLEAQIDFSKAEIARLQRRKALFEHAVERMEGYVIRVIQALGTDAKGKPKKLEGNTVTLSIRKCPVSVEIADENAVPLDYVTWSFRLPASLWEPILDSLDVELRAQVADAVKHPDITVSKTAVKEAIESGAAVPGARLVTDKYSLVRK